MTDEIVVRAIAADETRVLRERVLRPGQPLDKLIYPGDDDPIALHVGAFRGAEQIGIASVYPQAMDGTRDVGVWRLRGMAVVPEEQRSGIGSRILAMTLAHARRRGGLRYWCQARLVAVPFYTRHGLRVEGDLFEIPGIGPHYVMTVPLG